MRNTLLFPYFLLLLLALPCKAQNLVPDPGFEIFTENCEGYPALVHWFNPNLATPDLYSTEGCGNILTSELVSLSEIPAIPYEGIAYVGMQCCRSEFSTVQTREYLSIELTEFLVGGDSYEVSFALARRTLGNLAINKIGLYFSENPPSNDDGVVMDVEPQVETSGEVLLPELEWVSITNHYIAKGNERYLTIGNFREYNEMIVENTGTSWKDWNVAYYLFDDIQVNKTVSILNQEYSNIEIIVHLDDIQITSGYNSYFEIYNTVGSLIIHGNLNIGESRVWIEDLSSGIYLLRLNTKTGSVVKKFWKG